MVGEAHLAATSRLAGDSPLHAAAEQGLRGVRSRSF